MQHLFFIRHAESEANKNRILASRHAHPLTADGREDAGGIAGELPGITKIDCIVTSPLIRARQTAEPFASVYGLPVEIDERLSEQDLGPFSGKSYDEVKSMDGYENDPLSRWDWSPGGSGESYSQVADRVLGFLSDMEKRADGERILIVTHAVVFRLLRGALENTLPVYPEKFPNNGEIWDVAFRRLGEKNPIESIFLGNSRDFTHRP